MIKYLWSSVAVNFHAYVGMCVSLCSCARKRNGKGRDVFFWLIKSCVIYTIAFTMAASELAPPFYTQLHTIIHFWRHGAPVALTPSLPTGSSAGSCCWRTGPGLRSFHLTPEPKWPSTPSLWTHLWTHWDEWEADFVILFLLLSQCFFPQ